MANSVDPDQTAPIGAVGSGSTLFASILNSSVMLGAADDFSRRHFQMHFFFLNTILYFKSFQGQTCKFSCLFLFSVSF